METQSTEIQTTAGTDPAAPAKKKRGPYKPRQPKDGSAPKEAKAKKPKPLVVGVIGQGVRAICDAREFQKRRLIKYETKAEKRLMDQLWATLLFLQELYGKEVISDAQLAIEGDE